MGDISLGPRDISQDHRNKTRFMHFYYSHSRLLQEAWGSQHFIIYHHLLSAAAPPPTPIASMNASTVGDSAASSLTGGEDASLLVAAEAAALLLQDCLRGIGTPGLSGIMVLGW